jgi:hypothetical protein
MKNTMDMEQKNSNSFAFSLRETEELTRLAVKLSEPRKNECYEMNVMLSGDVRKGMEWVKMIDQMLTLKLKGAPYQPLCASKVYECKWLKIVVSDLSETEIRCRFRMEYTDVVNLDRPSETV